jgi:hypothetical protein
LVITAAGETRLNTDPSPISTPSTPAQAGEVVNEFLRLIMIPDPVAASRYTASDMKIIFTGKRTMRVPADCTKFNASRYKWVKKRIERTDVVMPSEQEAARGEIVVYSIGTLYGEWPDGQPFEGNRYVDRYVVTNGLITQMDVWNDSAEWMLVRAGLAVLVAP